MEMEISILISIVTLIPQKKLNSPPRFVILEDFQNQEYRFTIPKFLIRLAENQEKEGDEEHRQLENVMHLTVGDLPVRISKSSDFISGIFTNCICEVFRNNNFRISYKLTFSTLDYQKRDPTDKKYLAPINILPLFFSTFVKITYDKLYRYIKVFLTQSLCDLTQCNMHFSDCVKDSNMSSTQL